MDLFDLEMRQTRHYESSDTNHPAMRHHIPGRRETTVEASNLLANNLSSNPSKLSLANSLSSNPSNFLSPTV